MFISKIRDFLVGSAIVAFVLVTRLSQESLYPLADQEDGHKAFQTILVLDRVAQSGLVLSGIILFFYAFKWREEEKWPLWVTSLAMINTVAGAILVIGPLDWNHDWIAFVVSWMTAAVGTLIGASSIRVQTSSR